MDKLIIELIADHPEALAVLKGLFESEWEPYYGASGAGDAETDIKNSANRTELPIAVVAIFDGNICGTAALKMESVTTYPDFFPWLAGLLVAPEYRRQGIGEQLIIEIEKLAKQLGYENIYVGTGEKSGMSEITLDKRNWKYVDKSEYFVSEASVYKKKL
ncbi:MAG: GNAT family N-acetyltransferase [SAR324 cluster bacterium]|nr:GNAT family N-acetyltransferase [SAR324 cluster bacterium]